MQKIKILRHPLLGETGHFAWGPNSQKYEDSNEEEKIRGPPLAPYKSQFWADKSQNVPFRPEGFVLQF